MSKESKLEQTIPAFYKSKTLDCIMFGYLTCIERFFNERSISQGIADFMKDFNIDISEFDPASAKITYYRMKTKQNRAR